MTRVLAACLLAALAGAAEPSLRYDRPAKSWERERLPLGNGRLGAMLDGGVGVDRIQFNEESLWTGDANPSGGYDYKQDKPNSFGAYQNFGEVTVSIDGGASPTVRAIRPSGESLPHSGDESVAHSIDGDAQTKWCLEHSGSKVVWQVDLGTSSSLKSYALTSANDVPNRDPSDWVLEGSSDGKTWTELDRRAGLKPFGERHQRQVFAVAKPGSHRLFRLVFTPRDKTHFQLGEVELVGISLRGGPAPSGYERRLALIDGIHLTSVSGQSAREAFASAPAQVVVARYVFERPTSGVIALKDAHGNATRAAGVALLSQGRFTNGLEFASKLQAVLPKAGQVTVAGDTLRFEQCDELVLILGARTNYVMDPAKAFKGAAPLPRLEAEVAAAAAKGFAALRAEHVAEHRGWMTRVDVAWGRTDPAVAALPTDQRLQAYAKGGADPELESTLYQYGRYLLVGSSRPGCLPANLQGIWNESNQPAWASDYHNNINVQMCYWLAEVANLSECHVPLTDWIIASVPGCRDATRADKRFGANVRGWTVRTSQNIWGGNGWEWNLPGNAWLVQHAWEHYAYTLDKQFLRDRAYPLLKEVCEFWIDHLKALPDGRLVVPMGWSPEHGPREDGVAHDQQLVWDLFQNTIEASEALGIDKAFREELKAKQAKLVGPQIGRWGQLMEWMVDRDNPNDNHRHTSHLVAVFPGRQISVQRTPELAAAAMKSLEARGSVGDSRRSWTWAWRSAMWARFGRGDRVAEMIRGLMTHNMLPNLFALHPPFQLDGNYGIVAGISEALVQSHAGEIVLLPALPKSWPEGHANGLRARGAITVSELSWKEGRLSRAVLVSGIDQTVAVRVNGEVRQVVLKANQPAELR